MRRTQIALFALLVAAAALVIAIASRTRQPPILPKDAEHARFDGAEACMTCHGPDGPVPHGRNHPPGLDCLRCHGSR